MTDREQQPHSALVSGARNLGKAIIELLVGDGWSVAWREVSGRIGPRAATHGLQLAPLAETWVSPRGDVKGRERPSPR